ncbi:MAG: YabP/YqfC family sporulation protein [Clostridia bacterium]|nr:YabP/YqfC family sporulation protein [Clostridia bacterium]
MSKEKPKKRLPSAVEGWLNLPKGVVSNGYKITMIDNHELCLEGCKGILSYGSEEMRLHCGQRQLLVKGSSLVVKTLSCDYIELEGCIISIEFA